MKKKGKITSWIQDKGYGFLSPLDGSNRVFVHISAFSNRGHPPAVGDIVTYTLSTDARGRPCAKGVTIAGIPKATKPKKSISPISYAIAATFLLMVVGAAIASAIPMTILIFYVLLSGVTFAVYAFDKSAAKKGSWRTSESTLHLLALVGGWPGALIAQNSFRHKSRKQPFRTVFWITVVLNCTGFVWLLTPEGSAAWQSVVSAIAEGQSTQ